MARWGKWRSPAGLALIAALSFCPALSAQSAECNPALATGAEQIIQDSTITFSSVDFRNENPLSEDARAVLVKLITTLKLSVRSDEPDSDWLALAVDPIRLVLQEQGYYLSQVEGALTLVRSKEFEREYALNITINAGTQYRLGEIRITDATIFSAGELREQFELHPADWFDARKIFAGTEAIRRLYSDRGYVDQNLEPQISVDDEHHLINFTAKVNEGIQYHVGRIRILGLPPGMSGSLKSRPQAGAIFDRSSFDRFMVDNRAMLPEDASVESNLRLDRDTFNRSLEVVLDFRHACPEAPGPVQTAAN
jgi:Surface antigen variable number repeat